MDRMVCLNFWNEKENEAHEMWREWCMRNDKEVAEEKFLKTSLDCTTREKKKCWDIEKVYER